MKKFAALWSAGCLTLVHACCFGATYYVSVTGSDSNPGTQSQPWATLPKALNVAVAGDTVIEQPGLYSSFSTGISTVHDGQPGAPITLLAQPGAVHQGSGIYIGNSNYVVSGFTISNVTFAPHIMAGFVLGPSAHNTVIHDCALLDLTQDAYQYGVVWYTPNLDAKMKVAVDAAACNCVISNCVISNVFSCQPFLFAGTNNLIINNRIMYGRSSDVFVGHGANNYIRGNIVSNFEMVSGGLHPDMFQTYGQDGNVVSVSDPYFDAYHIVADHNQFWDCNISFAQLTTDDTNNIVTVADWEIINNLFVRCGSANGSISSISIPGTKWLNNTFILCGTNSNSSGDVLGFALHNQADPSTGDFRGQATNTTICNNAFIACGRNTNDGWFEIESGYGIPTNTWNFTVANNLVVDWSGTGWRRKNGQLQTIIKNNPNDADVYILPIDVNLGTDPKLLAWNQALRPADCRPLAGSPLIDAGANLAAYMANDFDGVARPLGNGYDIGCFEFDPNLQVRLDFSPNYLSAGLLADTSGFGHDAWNFNPTNWISPTSGPMGPAGQWTIVGVMSNEPGQTYNLSQYAGVTNLNGIQFLTNGTISVWVQWATNTERWDTVLDSGYEIAYAWDPTQDTNSWALHYGSPDLNVNPTGPVFKRYGNTLNDTNGVLLSWTQPRDGMRWWHLAVVWNAAENVIVGYQNGVAVQTNALGAPYLRISGSPRLGVAPFTLTPWLCVGAKQHDGTPQWGDDKYPNSGFFKGQMGDLRIYSRALSAAEVANLYAGPGAVFPSPSAPGGPNIAAPTLTFLAVPPTISPGQSSTLSWTSANATSITWEGFGTVSLNGSAGVFPTTTTTYTITATGSGGTTTASVTVTVASGSPPPTTAPPPTVTLTASPTTITSGQSTTLFWTTANTTSVTWVGFEPLSLNGNVGVWPAATTTYTVIATGPGGTATASTTVTVLASALPPAPSVTLTASPTTITSGQSTTLFWTTANATTLTWVGFGSVSLNGNVGVWPSATTTYTVTATGPGGTASASTTVTVGGTVEATAYPTAPVTFAATAGSIAAPFVANNGYVSQLVQTLNVADGGEATYNFNVDQPGQYAVAVLVNASSVAGNSLFVNVDAEPQSPAMIWDIPVTAGYQVRMAAWRGIGTETQDQFVPALFNLNAGPHQLIIRGREAGVQLQSISIAKRPNAPSLLRTQAN